MRSVQAAGVDQSHFAIAAQWQWLAKLIRIDGMPQHGTFGRLGRIAFPQVVHHARMGAGHLVRMLHHLLFQGSLVGLVRSAERTLSVAIMPGPWVAQITEQLDAVRPFQFNAIVEKPERSPGHDDPSDAVPLDQRAGFAHELAVPKDRLVQPVAFCDERQHRLPRAVHHLLGNARERPLEQHGRIALRERMHRDPRLADVRCPQGAFQLLAAGAVDHMHRMPHAGQGLGELRPTPPPDTLVRREGVADQQDVLARAHARTKAAKVAPRPSRIGS